MSVYPKLAKAYIKELNSHVGPSGEKAKSKGGHNFGHVMPMTLNMAETAVDGLLIPARVVRLCACVR